MANWITIAQQVALIVMVVLLTLATIRIWIGPHLADRLQALDLTTTLLIGIIVLLALLQNTSVLVDVGTALAAFGFVGTVAIARFISEGKVF